MKYRNSSGKLVEAPPDLDQHIAIYAYHYIVWSRRGNLHQVRYGLQVKQFQNSIEAAKEFGLCVHHHSQCEGLLD